MSHEIRTPMNGILGMAQLLQIPGLNESERQEYSRIIIHSGETLLNLLNDILDLSKVEAGKLDLQRSAFDPVQLIHEIVLLFKEPVESKGVRLENHWQGPPGVRYWGDPLRLRQMLSNLMSNATKFTASGLIRIEGREVERCADMVMLEFAVTDTGIGIAPDKLDVLFKPFNQVDGSITRQYGGSGLGLSIVSHLAYLMDGSTGVESQPGQGSRFWFRVRMACLTLDEERRQQEHPGPAPFSGDLRSGHAPILIVEDNPINCKVVETLLTKLGLPFHSVEHGAVALACLDHGLRPALVLMDCQMPVMDGFATTLAIRARERERGDSPLPIIALTANAFKEDRDRCLAVGMDDYLAKPVSFEQLKAVLRNWLPAGSVSQAVQALPVSWV